MRRRISARSVSALRVDVLRFEEPAALRRVRGSLPFSALSTDPGARLHHRNAAQRNDVPPSPDPAGPGYDRTAPISTRISSCIAGRPLRNGAAQAVGGFAARRVPDALPEFNALHPVAVDAPEECTDITAHVFQSLRFESTYRVPSYSGWLQRHGLLHAYRFHRRFLQHLDADLPGRRWILKSPDHVFALDDIRRVYPDARLVFIHRDPVRVLASVARLTEVLRRPFARSVDRVEVGRDVSASWVDGAQRMSALSARDDSVLHLHYQQIIRSPLDAVRAVYVHCNLVLTDEAEAHMRRWLTAVNVSRPWREYSLAEFGLDPHLLRERFARYTDTFGIEIERRAGEATTAALP